MSEGVKDEPKNFACRHCGKQFLTASWLEKHEETHHIICNFCHQSFTSKPSYNEHLKHGCKKRKSYSCSSCEECFTHAGDLLHHLRVCSKGEKNLWCKICHKQYYDEISYKVHVETHSSGPYSCDICEHIADTHQLLTEHLKLHLMESNQYGCRCCEKVFLTKYSLRKHMQVHTVDELVCNVCKAAFSNVRSFRLHVKTHSQRPIDVENDPLSASADTAVNLFKCDICYINFFNLEKLRSHVSSHSDICDQDSSLFQQASTDMGIQVDNIFFTCDVCNKYICVEISKDLNLLKKRETCTQRDLNKPCRGKSRSLQTVPLLEHVYADFLDLKNPTLVHNCTSNISNYYDIIKREKTLVENRGATSKYFS